MGRTCCKMACARTTTFVASLRVWILLGPYGTDLTPQPNPCLIPSTCRTTLSARESP